MWVWGTHRGSGVPVLLWGPIVGLGSHWVPLGSQMVWGPTGLPGGSGVPLWVWHPIGVPCGCGVPLGSPWGPTVGLGSHWVPLGPTVGLGSRWAPTVGLGSHWVPLVFPWGPTMGLGSRWAPRWVWGPIGSHGVPLWAWGPLGVPLGSQVGLGSHVVPLWVWGPPPPSCSVVKTSSLGRGGGAK